MVSKTFLGHLSNSCYGSCVNIFFSKTTGPNFVCSIFRIRRQEIVNFMTPTPRRGNFGVKRVKLMNFLKNLLYSGAWFRQTKYIVVMTKEGSTKIVNFMIPWAGVLMFVCECVMLMGGRQGCSKLCIMFMTCINIQHIHCYCVKWL